MKSYVKIFEDRIDVHATKVEIMALFTNALDFFRFHNIINNDDLKFMFELLFEKKGV